MMEGINVSDDREYSFMLQKAKSVKNSHGLWVKKRYYGLLSRIKGTITQHIELNLVIESKMLKIKDRLELKGLTVYVE